MIVKEGLCTTGCDERERDELLFERLLRMRARAKMTVKEELCTTGCDERELCVFCCLSRVRARAKMIVKEGLCTTGCDKRGFVYECAPRVLFKGHGEDGREDDSCGEVQRGGGGEHAAETNAQVGPLQSQDSCQCA